jgi:ABC-type antimicrobial peptide transport system permease subunit
MIVFIRAVRDPGTLVPEVRRVVHELAPRLPIYGLQTMVDRTAGAIARPRFNATLFTLFAITALTLAAVGIYGVMSLAVAARGRGMGIRIALGADRGRIQRCVIGEAARLVAIGSAIGLAGAFATTRVLRSTLFDITPSDPPTYAIVVMVLGTVGVVASWIPARRASRIEPVVSMRSE